MTKITIEAKNIEKNHRIIKSKLFIFDGGFLNVSNNSNSFVCNNSNDDIACSLRIAIG